MTVNKRATAPPSPEPQPKAAAPAAVTEHDPAWDRPITREEYEEIPELADAEFEALDLYRDGKLVRRGRPRSPAPKELVSLRLPPEVLAHFRAQGPGWRQRIEIILRAVVSTERDAAERLTAQAANELHTADEQPPS